MLWTKGDYLLYFVLGCQFAFVLLNMLNSPWAYLFFAIGYLYIALLYSKDKKLRSTYFFSVYNVSSFYLHFTKVMLLSILIFFHNLLFFVFAVYRNGIETDLLFLLSPFLSLYTFILFYNIKNDYLKFVIFLFIGMTIFPLTSIYSWYFICFFLPLITLLIFRHARNESHNFF